MEIKTGLLKWPVVFKFYIGKN